MLDGDRLGAHMYMHNMHMYMYMCMYEVLYVAL